MTFAELYARIKAATSAVFGRKPKYRELTPEEQRAVADKWLAFILQSYILKAAGESYNGQRWQKRKPNIHDDGHLLLIQTGKLYNAVKNSTVTVLQGKNGVLEFHAEVASTPYRDKRKEKKLTTRDVFVFHQYGTPKCPARPIFVKLSPKDQKELDDFVKGFLQKESGDRR
jgi:phage gpG-like protein